jgi:hypothetical protein
MLQLKLHGHRSSRIQLATVAAEGAQYIRSTCLAKAFGTARSSYELFLQASEPKWRIFINPSVALHVDISPSGFVPGGVLSGRRSVVLLRWKKRTRLLFLDSFEVLYAKCEDVDVISFFFLVLLVTCIHRLV